MKRLILFFAFTLIVLTQATAQQPFKGGSGNYQKLIWSDEFNGSGLPDTTKWRYDTGFIANHEMQYYTEARLQNIQLKDGTLQITARNDSLKHGSGLHPITSARINTKGKGEWTYGRIEARAKMPSSLGTWPAIWMLGADIDRTDWPACGEIDILEHVGYMPDTVHFNVHTEKYNHVKGTNKGTTVFSKAPYNDFHIYAIEWFPDHIDWYFDDKKVFTYTNEKTGTAAWPFDKPQFLILNLAFGGDWGGSKGVNIASLPQTFLVDYVRVFQ
jgi:beta-glucanase (GH16 family)